MSKIRRVDFSPDEFLSGTSELTLEETGGYWKACSLIYSRGGPIADDPAWLARVCGCNARTWGRIRGRLLDLGKLRVVDVDGKPHLTNGRAERELGHAKDRIDQARRAAEESARKRRERAENDRKTPETLAQTDRNSGANGVENQGNSADFNGLGRADAPGGARANHQPSTINHQSKKDSHTGATPRAQPLPAGWEPSAEDIAYAQAHRPDIQPARLKLETEGFRQNAIANGRTFLPGRSIGAAWRAWILKTRITSTGGASPNGQGHREGKRIGAGAKAAAGYAAYRQAARGRSDDGDGGGESE